MLAVVRGHAASETEVFGTRREWTVKEVLGTINDASVFLRTGRCVLPGAIRTPLVGIRTGGFRSQWRIRRTDSRGPCGPEFGSVRNASVALFSFVAGRMPEPRRGVASQKEVTVRALAFITAGHTDPPPGDPGRTVFSGDSARLNQERKSEPDARVAPVDTADRPGLRGDGLRARPRHIPNNLFFAAATRRAAAVASGTLARPFSGLMSRKAEWLPAR